MTTKRLIALLLTAMMAFATLAACTPNAPGTTTTAGAGTAATTAGVGTTTTTASNATPAALKSYRETLSSDIETLNAHNDANSNIQYPYDWAASTLWRRVPAADGISADFVGDLADGDPIVDATGYVWTINLKKDTHWNDGTPINADTFIYTYKMFLDPNLVNVMANFFYSNSIRIKGAQDYYYQGSEGYPETVSWDEVGFQKIDDYTLQLTTDGRFTAFDVMNHFVDRSMHLVYEPFYEAGMNEDRTTTTYGTTLDQWMGNGPYTYEKWEQGAAHIFVKNPDHWMADYYHYDRVEIRIVSDNNAKVTMWEKGELDYLLLNSATIDLFRDDPRLRSWKNISVTHIDVNSMSPNPIMQTQEIRNALYWAIDRAEIAKVFSYAPAALHINGAAAAFPEDGILYRDTPEALAIYPENHGYDPVKANEYFDLAREKAGIAAGEKVNIRFLYYTEATDYKKLAEYLGESLVKVFGADRFSLEVIGLPGNAVWPIIDWQAGAYDWDLTCENWGASVSRTYPHKAERYFVDSYSGRPNSYLSERFDAQFAVCEQEEIMLDRQRLLEETVKLELIYLEDIVNIPVYGEYTYALYSEKLTLPLTQYVPGFGYGQNFADIAE